VHTFVSQRSFFTDLPHRILAEDLPYLPMWFNDVVSVHRRQLGTFDLPSTGNYNFLATLHPNHD